MNNINRIVFFIIIIEFLYMYFVHLRISEFRLSSLVSITRFFNYYYIYICLIIASILVYLYIAFTFGIYAFLAIILLFTSILLYLEYKLNVQFTQEIISEKDIYEECQTGDLILIGMENPIPNLFHLIPTLFLGMNHIGIVVKKSKHEIFLLELLTRIYLNSNN